MGQLFWYNLELILAHRGMSWKELTRQMFEGKLKYPSELERQYMKIRHYKSNHHMPQVQWVDRIVLILDIEYEDLFKKR